MFSVLTKIVLVVILSAFLYKNASVHDFLARTAPEISKNLKEVPLALAHRRQSVPEYDELLSLRVYSQSPEPESKMESNIFLSENSINENPSESSPLINVLMKTGFCFGIVLALMAFKTYFIKTSKVDSNGEDCMEDPSTQLPTTSITTAADLDGKCNEGYGDGLEIWRSKTSVTTAADLDGKYHEGYGDGLKICRSKASITTAADLDGKYHEGYGDGFQIWRSKTQWKKLKKKQREQRREQMKELKNLQ